MAPRFFDLSDDLYVPHRWYLAPPTDSQGRKVFDWDFKLSVRSFLGSSTVAAKAGLSSSSPGSAPV